MFGIFKKQVPPSPQNFSVGDRVQFITEYIYSSHRNKVGTVIYANNDIRLWGVKFDDGSEYEVHFHGKIIKIDNEKS